VENGPDDVGLCFHEGFEKGSVRVSQCYLEAMCEKPVGHPAT
jgi:hypothetical protein